MDFVGGANVFRLSVISPNRYLWTNSLSRYQKCILLF